MTLNGDFTVTSGALVSVDPVTATLPVAPASVHSAAVPSAGGAVGQPSLADLSIDDAGAADDEVSDVELHAESVAANVAAQARTAKEEDSRGKFTLVTLQRDPKRTHRPFHLPGNSPIRLSHWKTWKWWTPKCHNQTDRGFSC